MNKENSVGKLNLRRHQVNEVLLKQARKEGNIVYGSQSIKRKLGINARRPSGDFDFFSNMPKKSAQTSEKNLDKLFRKDVFFYKKGVNPSTYKVKHKGKDLKSNTDDDIGIADYTKTPKPKPKTFLFRNVKYRNLSEELKAKKRLVNNPQFRYRRDRDLEDLKRIKRFGGLK